MDSSTIKHKLRVFISSKCGDKYTIARKALKELLLSTGLVDEPYVFECEPASSDNTVSSYLDYVDDSNMCIFLIDNYDGVPDPVLSEEKRAKEKGLRLIYIFCDEKCKVPTIMQNEIKTNMSQKYDVVSSFSDIVKAAYDSAMQDIVNVYKSKHILQNALQNDAQVENCSLTPTINDSATITEQAIEVSYNTGTTTCFAKKYLKSISKTEKALLDLASFGAFYNGKESNEFDEDLSRFLEIAFYKEPFSNDVFKELVDKIIAAQPKSMNKLLSSRYSVIKYYFNGNFADALKEAQCALAESIENENIPNWISLDIAIDIRNIVGKIDQSKSQHTIDNSGQKFIDENPEMLCYPEIDRLVSDYQSKLYDHYFKIRYTSPYTTNLGGYESLFTPIAKALCLAFSNGSLVHILMTRKYMIEVLYALSCLYSDHDIRIELIRQCIFVRDKNKLETIERTYNNGSEIVNATDANEIYKSLNNIGYIPHQIMSKCLCLTYLGFYFDDKNYETYSAELLTYIEHWITDKNRIFDCWEYINCFLKSNCYRIDNNIVIATLLSVFENGLKRWYDNCLGIMSRIDYSCVTAENQAHILGLFTSLLLDKETANVLSKLKYALFVFSKDATIDTKVLLDAIEKEMPDFYNKEFRLGLLSNDSDELIKYIEEYTDSAIQENKTQGENGTYSGYASNPLETIKNIISILSIELPQKTIEAIINVSIDTLKAPRQIASAKSKATELLILLHSLYSGNSCWDRVFIELDKNKSTFSCGKEMGFFDKYTNCNLDFAYKLLLLSFDNRFEDDVLEYLLTLDSDDSYGIIDAIELLNNLISQSNVDVYSNNFISGCTNFAIMMTSTNERDVVFLAAKCLIEMIKYNHVQRIILQHLSKMMDTGVQSIKTAIVSKVKVIRNTDNEYADYILKKASIDNNYLVRLAAEIHSAK